MENNKPTRDDSLLNTGLSSAIERRAKARAEEQRKKRANERAALTPGGEIVIEWINREIKDASDLTKMIVNIDTEENVRAQLLARQYEINFLKDMKNRAKSMMREAKKADKAAEKQARAEETPAAWSDGEKK